jgi:alkanesulfonate monooxygenase SsuD/methylene tetrahydromethanopterin reductase-like flavin-dependent oxidoreductase (luciferase family)
MTIAGEPRTGLVLRDALPWPEFETIVGTAEQTGYESVFVPEISGREAFATLAAAASVASRIRLGTGVVTMWSRTPTTTAMAAATVHERSGGRMVLGLGAGTPPPGGPEESPLARMAAYVDVVRHVWSGEPVGTDPRFGSEGFALTLPLEPPEPPPIWLGALGNGMIRLAGRIADGVLLNWCTPDRAARARALVAESAAEAGRDPEAVTVAVYVRACLGVEEAVALDALRPMTGLYASFPHYRRQLEEMGLGDAGAAAARAAEAGRPRDVPEELVRALCLLGGRPEAVRRFDAFRAAGADVVLCYPVAALDPFSSVLGTALAAAPSPAVER